MVEDAAFELKVELSTLIGPKLAMAPPSTPAVSPTNVSPLKRIEPALLLIAPPSPVAASSENTLLVAQSCPMLTMPAPSVVPDPLATVAPLRIERRVLLFHLGAGTPAQGEVGDAGEPAAVGRPGDLEELV